MFPFFKWEGGGKGLSAFCPKKFWNFKPPWWLPLSGLSWLPSKIACDPLLLLQAPSPHPFIDDGLKALKYDFQCSGRAVIKSRGPGISPGYYECGPRLFLMENKGKLEPKETPRSLIPRLLVVFTQQLEILTTTLVLGTKFEDKRACFYEAFNLSVTQSAACKESSVR